MESLSTRPSHYAPVISVPAWLSAQKSHQVAAPNIIPSLPSQNAKKWFPPRILAYFELRQLERITQDGTIVHKQGFNRQPPPFNKRFSALLKNWFHDLNSLTPTNWPKIPSTTLSVKNLLEPLVRPYLELLQGPEKTSYFSLVGRSVKSIPNEYYPWEIAFEMLQLPPYVVQLLLRALGNRVKSAPRDIDLRIQIPYGFQDYQYQAEAVEKVAFWIIHGFAMGRIPEAPRIIGQNNVNPFLNQPYSEIVEQIGKPWFSSAVADYFQPEQLKIIPDQDWRIRRMTRILHPDFKMRPPGLGEGSEVPLEIIVAGTLRCPQLHLGGPRVPLDDLVFNRKGSIRYVGQDVWTGLLCMAMGNCRVADLSAVDEQAWCRLVQAYCEGESCFRCDEEAELVNILFRQAAAEVEKKMPQAEILLVDIIKIVSNWFKFFCYKHEAKDSLSLGSLYFNAIRTLGGLKLFLPRDEQEVTPDSLDITICQLLRSTVSFQQIDSALQIVGMLAIGLCPRDDCKHIEIDFTGGSYALRVWMESNQARRSLLTPWNIPAALTHFSEALQEAPCTITGVMIELLPHMIADSREESTEMAAFLCELGLSKEHLQPLVDLLLSSTEAADVYAGLLLAELLQKIAPGFENIKGLLPRLPVLLPVLNEQQKKGFLTRLHQLFKGTPYPAFLDAKQAFAKELFGTTDEVQAYLMRKLVPLRSNLVCDDPKLFMADSALNDRLLQLLGKEPAINKATSLQLLSRLYKQMECVDFWAHIKKVVAALPFTLDLETIISLNYIAEIVFSPAYAETIKDDPHPPVLLTLLTYTYDQISAFMRLKELSKHVGDSPAIFAQTWLTMLENALIQGQLETVKTYLPFLLQKQEILQVYTQEQRYRLCGIVQKTGMNAPNLERMAEHYLKIPGHRLLGMILFSLLYQVYEQHPISLLPLRNLVHLFSEVSGVQQQQAWSLFAELYSRPLETAIFFQKLPQDLCQKGSNITFAWITILMKSENNSLIMLGKELLEQHSRSENAIRFAEKFLPEIATADLPEAVNTLLKLMPDLSCDRLYNCLETIFSLCQQPYKEKDQEALKKLTVLLVNVTPIAAKKELGRVLWLIDQLDDPNQRMRHLNQCANAVQKELVAGSWLRLIMRWPNLEYISNALYLPLLDEEDQKELVRCLHTAVPDPIVQNNLEMLTVFLQKNATPLFMQACQGHFEKGLSNLLHKEKKVWHIAFPFLTEATKFALYPLYLSQIEPSQKAFASAFAQYVRFSIPSGSETKFIQAATLLLRVGEKLQPAELAPLMDSLIDHCALTPSQQTQNIGKQIAGLLPVLMPHLKAADPMWLLAFESAPEQRLCLLFGLLEHKLLLADARSLQAIIQLCEELKIAHPDLVWAAILQSGSLHIRFAPEDLQSFYGAVPPLFTLTECDQASSLLELYPQTDLFTILCERLFVSLEKNAAENSVDPLRLHQCCKKIINYLDPKQKSSLLCTLVDQLAKHEQHACIVSWIPQWLALDDRPELAPLFVRSALKLGDLENPIKIASRPTSQLDIDLLIDVLVPHLSASGPLSAQAQNLLTDLLINEPTSYGRLLSLISSSQTPFTLQKINECLAQCPENQRTDVLVAFCLHLVHKKKANDCALLLAAHINESWVQFHNIALSDEVAEICEALAAQNDPAQLPTLLTLQANYPHRSLPFWYQIWTLLNLQDVNLIMRAYAIFSDISDDAWSPSTTTLHLLEVWAKALYVLSSSHIDEPKGLVDRLMIWENADYPVEMKRILWQELYLGRLSYAKAHNKPEIVENLTVELANNQGIIRSVDDPFTACLITATIVQVGFSLKMQQSYPVMIQVAIHCFTVLPLFPVLKRHVQEMLAYIVLSPILIDSIDAKKLYDSIKNKIGNTERYFLLSLFSRYSESDFSEHKAYLEDIVNGITESQFVTEDQWGNVVYEEILIGLSNSTTLMPIEYAKKLAISRRAPANSRECFAYIKWLMRYQTAVTNLIAARFLLHILQTKEPLDQDLCRTLCAELNRLPTLPKDRTYLEILRSNRTVEFIGPAQIMYLFSSTLAQRFYDISIEENVEIVRVEIEWALNHLNHYLGRSEHSVLTTNFIMLLLTAYDGTNEALRLISDLSRFFNIVKNNTDPHCMTLFFLAKDAKRRNDFKLAAKVALQLFAYRTVSIGGQATLNNIAVQFLENLTNVKSAVLTAQLSVLQPLVARLLVIHAVSDFSNTRVEATTSALFAKWSSRLGSCYPPTALAILEPQTDDQPFSYEHLETAVESLILAATAKGFDRARVLINRSLSFYLRDPNDPDTGCARLEPLILQFIEGIHRHPHLTFSMEGNAFNVAHLMIGLLGKYYEQAKACNAVDTEHFLLLFNTQLAGLLENITKYREHINQPSLSQQGLLLTVHDRFCEISDLINITQDLGWQPEIILSYQDMIQKSLEAYLPYFPLVAIFEIEKDFKEHCKGILQHLSADEKEQLAKKLKSIQPPEWTAEQRLKGEKILNLIFG